VDRPGESAWAPGQSRAAWCEYGIYESLRSGAEGVSEAQSRYKEVACYFKGGWLVIPL
jgi:hypothetical protein